MITIVHMFKPRERERVCIIRVSRGATAKNRTQGIGKGKGDIKIIRTIHSVAIVSTRKSKENKRNHYASHHKV